jgi:archaellum component FlaC
MSTRVLDRVEEWDQRQFTGGYRGLQDLADQEFSGAVRADRLELFMTRGVAIAVRGGDIEAFEAVSGTAHEAPSPALPLLAVMQERSDEVRDRFYTERTAISEVDETLSAGGFTGYVELSENVLSGDYYLVYHAGKSMSVGFVGQSGRLIDGQEALETANDEVGIYQVRPVEIRPLDVPEPEPTPPGGETTPEDQSGADDGERDRDEADDDEMGAAARESTVSATDTADETGQEPPSGQRDPTEARAGEETQESVGPADGEGAPAQESAESTADAAGTDGASDETAGAEAPVGGTDIEIRTIPSVDPARTARNGATETVDEVESASADHSDTPQPPQEPADHPGEESEEPPTEASASGAKAPDAEAETDDATAVGSAAERLSELETERDDLQEQLQTVREQRDELQEQLQTVSEQRDDLQKQLQTVREERDELQEQLQTVSEERDDLQEQLQTVREERDDLQEQLQTVREERDDLQEQLQAVSEERDEQLGGGDHDGPVPAAGAEGDASDDGPVRELPPRDALTETVVFVRYRSQGDVTLKNAHAGDGDQQSLAANLQLEVYGGFEGSVEVEGQPYETFVEETLAYEFVEWTVTDLPFEIRATGNRTALKGLYDALPAVDHADLQGSVDLAEESEPFDIVLRDQRERPLLVATIDSSRNPVTGDQMEQFVTAVERVGQAEDSLQGAFLVGRSYFDGNALDIADEATKGRLLSRDKRKSFVSISRKQGYHLCLVEAREGSLHLAVPEL